jgi:hypothetical protein
MMEQLLSGPLWNATTRLWISHYSVMARHLAAALERNCTLTWLDLDGNGDIGPAGAAAFRAALETNYTLDMLTGVDGVDNILILERNRGVCVARNNR